jgi:uncharacterized protein (TIGR03032 family)
MKPPPPFSCTHTPNLPELLWQMECSVVLSTYQAGKVVIISAKNEEELVQLPRAFPQAMALGVKENRLAVASQHEVTVLAHEPGLAPGYPAQPKTYDTIFMPRASYYTGTLDIHGLAWGEGGLWAINTLFSSLGTIDDTFSFTPRWKPPFITKLMPEDRCHLNGMAMREDTPLWVTALGRGDSAKSWRETITTGGVLIHVPSGEIVAGELPMPHTPRLYDGRLLLLLSATGEIVAMDTSTGKYDVIKKVPGFIRGMTRQGEYLFVAQSRIRKKSSAFRHLEIADDATSAGFTVLHLPTASIVAEFRYQSSVDEIYDIEVLPGLRRPGILNPEKKDHHNALTLPGTYFRTIREKN